MDREEGFYWLKQKAGWSIKTMKPLHEWTIGRWCGGSWEVMGWHNDICYSDEEIGEVGPMIAPPDAP